jgi:hypothetical protein
MAIYGDGKHDGGIITTPRKYTKRKGSGIDKPFQVTSVCKRDILGLIEDEKGLSFTRKDVLKLTEADMGRIADKMSNAYVENGFWIDLEIITEAYLEQKNKNK